MAARSIASLTLSFGLVHIPVRLFSATESASELHFHMMTAQGHRVRQQLVDAVTEKPVERASLKRGYEFERDQYVIFENDELDALEDAASHVVEILSFVPDHAIDPIYYDSAFFIAPDKRGAKPYWLLHRALTESGRVALAKWATRGKTRIVQVRPANGGMVFQQLLFADEVRSLDELDIEKATVTAQEMTLAAQIIEQGAADAYDPSAYEDEEKARVLAAIDKKIAGKKIVVSDQSSQPKGAEVIDLMEALRASLGSKGTGKKSTTDKGTTDQGTSKNTKASERTKAPVKRAAKKAAKKVAKKALAAPARKRAA